MTLPSRFRVAILDRDPGKHFETPDVETEILAPTADIELIRAPLTEDVGARIEDMNAIIVWSRFDLGRDVVARLKHCRGIVCASVGYEHVDLQAASERHIPVCNVPDYGTEEVADHTIALILAIERGILPLDTSVRAGAWDWKQAGSVRRLRGCRLGIIGFGRIGSAVARRAQAFGLDVSFYDPYVPSGIEKSHGVRRHEDLAELLTSSHIVSLHAPLTPETAGMFDHTTLSKMRTDAVLINTARGGLIDSGALALALREGRLRGAGLDVLAEEPRVLESLSTAPRVILTPHAGWHSEAAFHENRKKAAEAACRFLLGQAVRTQINQWSS